MKQNPMTPDFYIATDGDDSWSGRHGEPNQNRTDGPFATFDAAQRAARQLKEGLETPGESRAITVALRGGEYFLPEPVVFHPGDSGSREYPITYRSMPGEHAELTGGRRITGWRRRDDGAWSVTLPEVRDGTWFFRSLWVDGQRRSRPVLPKEGTYRVTPASERSLDSFGYNPGEIDPGWKNRDDVEIVVVQFWTEARLRILDIDEDEHLVKFTGSSWRPLSWSKAWFAENVYEALDRPGEWYLDRGSGELTYLALPGEDPNENVVMAPVSATLIRIEGNHREERPVEWITFEGLNLGYTHWEMPYPHGISIPQAEIPGKDGVVFAGDLTYGADNPQVAVPVPATFFASGMRNCSLIDNEIAHTGGWAVELADGCREIAIDGNHIHDIGAGAVRIGEPALPESETDVTMGTRVTNNVIQDGSNVFLGPAAIWIGQSSGNLISHNEISGAFEWGISTGWSWNYWPPAWHRDNIVEYNHIHHLGESHTGCHGAIYFLGVSPGTICRGNLVHHIEGGCGIILDNACFGLLIEYNLTHHTGGAGLCFNYNDSGNIVQNNVFALSKTHAYERYGDPPATGGEKVDQTGILYRNIFYWAEGEFMRRKEWANYDTLMNYNLYWDTREKEISFAGLDIDRWRENGLDTESLIADPLFADPENGDFSLPPDSPAMRVGFRPLDASRAGPLPGRGSREVSPV
jgi:hypothetical protein